MHVCRKIFWIGFSACFLLGSALSARGAGEPIVPEGAKLELLFTRTADLKGGLTEGPAAAPDGSIYFTDIPAGDQKGMILRFDPKTRTTSVFSADSGKANGMRFNAQGELLACEGADFGGRRIALRTLTDPKGRTIVDRYQEKRFNSPNDLTIDAKGRIYFTDPRYAGPEPRELKVKAVYRVDAQGAVVEVTHDVEQPNGLGLSPDGKTLYVVDHNNGGDGVEATPPKKGAMKVYAFPLDDEGLVRGERKTVIDFGADNGADGMRIDQAGRLFLASRNARRPGILVLEPSGQEVAFVPTGPANQQDAKEPQGIPSNCEFGVGDESNMLYITADTSLYRIRLNTKGFRAGRAN